MKEKHGDIPFRFLEKGLTLRGVRSSRNRGITTPLEAGDNIEYWTGRDKCGAVIIILSTGGMRCSFEKV